jgi:hypothetical protein
MSQQEETKYQEAIQAWIAAQGGDSWKVHGHMMQSAGQPDIDGWIPTRMGSIPLKVEVKTPTGEPSELQKVRLRKYNKSGAYLACIVVTPEDLAFFVEAYLEALETLRDIRYVLDDRGYDDIHEIYSTKDQRGYP